MVLGGGGLVLIELVLLVYCVLNVATTPAEACRNLPKLVWLLLVIFLPLVGGIAWLVAGRPQTRAAGVPGRGQRGIPAAYDRPGRSAAASPDDDAAFMQHLRERADRQREDARRQRAEADAREEQARQDAWQRQHPGEAPPEA